MLIAAIVVNFNSDSISVLLQSEIFRAIRHSDVSIRSSVSKNCKNIYIYIFRKYKKKKIEEDINYM